MDIKKAIEILKAKKDGNQFIPRQSSPLIEAIELAIQALEKQVSKKPIMQEWSPAICPCCECELSVDLGDGYYQHSTFLERCPECNQKLSWEEISYDEKNR